MSVGGAVTLAVKRNRMTTGENVSKRDIGKSESGGKATTLDILATVVPTGMVAPYTGFVAVVAGLAVATEGDPKPDEYIGWRLILFSALVVATIIYVIVKWLSERATGDSFPWLVLASTTIAAVAWGLATPESWLFAVMEGNAKAVVPAAIGAVGALLLAALAPILRTGTKPPA